MDEKFKAIESIHKNDGFVWVVKFWQKAYTTNTGNVDLNGIFGVLQAENCRITTQTQEEIIRSCLDIGLIYEISSRVYSSTGIQKRLDLVIKNREFERKRKNKAVLHLENPPLMPQSKVKESKVKERKVKKSKEKMNTIPFALSLEEFSAKLPEIWSEEEKSYWHERAVAYSNKGHKYINWVLAIKDWRKKNPNQYQPKNVGFKMDGA